MKCILIPLFTILKVNYMYKILFAFSIITAYDIMHIGSVYTGSIYIYIYIYIKIYIFI